MIVSVSALTDKKFGKHFPASPPGSVGKLNALDKPATVIQHRSLYRYRIIFSVTDNKIAV